MFKKKKQDKIERELKREIEPKSRGARVRMLLKKNSRVFEKGS